MKDILLNNVAISVILFVGLVVAHNYSFFALVSRMLDRCRVPRLGLLAICLFNGILLFFYLPYIKENYTFFFLSITLVLLIEFLICYKNTLTGIITCSTALILHILVLRSIITSIYALVIGESLYYVAHHEFYSVDTITITLFVHIFVILAVIKIIPEKYLKIINQNKEFSFPLCLMSSLFLGYMIYNGIVYDELEISISMEIPQIVLPIVFLIALYLGIYMMIKMSNMYGYKAKHNELASQMDKEKVYKNVLMDRTTAVIEANCSKNQIITYMRMGKSLNIEELGTGTQFLENYIKDYVHSSDQLVMLEHIIPEKLIDAFNRGENRFAYDYKSNYLREDYSWLRIEITLNKNEDNDIIAMMTVSEIQLEKEAEMKLRYRAERDSLTGVRNKEMTQILIDDYLTAGGTGTLFMFDLDNFKEINDSLGHSYGDEVLKESCRAIEEIFREMDIVGRVGGDEFVVFMKKTTTINTIKDKAEKVRVRLSKSHLANDGQIITVTPSIGVSIANLDGKTYDELFDKADKAMYYSKKHGKNTYTVYDEATLSSKK